MQLDLIVAIIGAGTAVLGALISTVSIILTNKNTKAIHLLENSKDVKTEISKKRLELYTFIISYINSWYDIKRSHEHNYIECKARKHLRVAIFECRFKNVDDIIDEYNKVLQLSLGYFYLDAKSYRILKSLENYLICVINYAKTNKVENFNLFCYIAYCDVWDYIFRLSKPVNKFIRKSDTLKFKQSSHVKQVYIARDYYKTNFHNIYDKYLLCYKVNEELIGSTLPDIEKANKTIELGYEKLKNIKDNKTRKLLYEKIRLLKKYNKRLSKIKLPKKYYKVKMNDSYKMWMICKSCKNKCILANKDGEKDEI